MALRHLLVGCMMMVGWTLSASAGATEKQAMSEAPASVYLATGADPMPSHLTLRLDAAAHPTLGVVLTSGRSLSDLTPSTTESRFHTLLVGSRQECGRGSDCGGAQHNVLDTLARKPMVAAVMSSVNVARQPGASAVVWLSPLNPKGRHLALGLTPGGYLMAFHARW